MFARLYGMSERDCFPASVGDEHDVFGQQGHYLIDVPALEGGEEPAYPFQFDRFCRNRLLLGYIHFASCSAQQGEPWTDKYASVNNSDLYGSYGSSIRRITFSRLFAIWQSWFRSKLTG